MSHEDILKWVLNPFDSATNHFSKIFDQLETVAKTKNSELEVVSNFFKEFKKIESKYKNDLVEICVKYQKQVYEAFSDEKMQQFFQMLFNNMLKRCDRITRSQDLFKEMAQKMTVMNGELQKNIKFKIDTLRNEMEKYYDLLTKSKKNYSNYLEKCKSLKKETRERKYALLDEIEDIRFH